jgi:hypothetical protein
LNCIDIAGNIRTVVKEFMVDLNDPEVRITRPLSSNIRIFNGLIEWEVIESVGISMITLNIDGVDYHLSSSSRYFVFDLEKGSHSIVIIITDGSGREDEANIDFIIDPDPPDVRKGEIETSIDGSNAQIYWKLGEDKDNLTKMLTLDGEIVNIEFDLDEGSFLFGELESGNHSIILLLQDQAGNEKQLEWLIVIEEKGGGDPLSSSVSLGIKFLLIVLFLFITGGTLAGYLYIKKRPKVEKKKIEMPKKPNKIVIGPRPAHLVMKNTPTRHRVQHKSHSIKSPLSTVKYEGQKVGHGYIRPDQSSDQVKRMIIDSPTDSDKYVQPKDPSINHPNTSEVIEEWDGGEEIEDWDNMEDF